LVAIRVNERWEYVEGILGDDKIHIGQLSLESITTAM
jgi:hypothetical protein